MFDEPGRGEAGPWQCVRCDARLAAPLLFCPACGATQRSARAPARGERAFAPPPSPPPSRPPGFAGRLRAWCGASPYGAGYPVIGYEAIDEKRGAPRARLPLYACSVLALVACMLAVYLMTARGRYEPVRSVQVTEGSVRIARDATHATAANTKPAAESAVATDPGAPAPKRAANAPRVARQLALARANLTRNRLWPARRAIQHALAGQPGNDDAQRLRTELMARERQRDALLGYARQCARGGQWDCVRQYAGRAASVDTSSREARRLLARAAGDRRDQRDPRGQRERIAVQRADPDLFARLHRWFERSIAQAQQAQAQPPRRPSPWDHP